MGREQRLGQHSHTQQGSRYHAKYPSFQLEHLLYKIALRLRTDKNRTRQLLGLANSKENVLGGGSSYPNRRTAELYPPVGISKLLSYLHLLENFPGIFGRVEQVARSGVALKQLLRWPRQTCEGRDLQVTHPRIHDHHPQGGHVGANTAWA